MSLAQEVKFPCSYAASGDLPNHMTVYFNSHRVMFRVEDDGGTCDSGLDRSQVKSLRDRLTIWLGESQ